MTEGSSSTEAVALGAVSLLAREEGGRVLAFLARRYNSVDIADESVQDALVEATRTWPTRGVPTNPTGWLMSVANRKAIDRLRRASTAQRLTSEMTHDLMTTQIPADESADDESTLLAETSTSLRVTDEPLRLMLLCCHPSLDRPAQIALTLKLVGGLTTPEIARRSLFRRPRWRNGSSVRNERFEMPPSR